MFAIIFGIARILIDRTFNEQLNKDVLELRTNISNMYSNWVNTIHNDVKARGETVVFVMQ